MEAMRWCTQTYRPTGLYHQSIYLLARALLYLGRVEEAMVEISSLFSSPQINRARERLGAGKMFEVMMQTVDPTKFVAGSTALSRVQGGSQSTSRRRSVPTSGKSHAKLKTQQDPQEISVRVLNTSAQNIPPTEMSANSLLSSNRRSNVPPSVAGVGRHESARCFAGALRRCLLLYVHVSYDHSTNLSLPFQQNIPFFFIPIHL